MSKYIDADKLKEFYKPYAERKLSVPVDVILLNIDDMPTEDVQEVKHGRWIVEHGVLAGDGIYGDMGKCSVCGVHLRNYEWNYCPNCGSRMDLDGDTE